MAYNLETGPRNGSLLREALEFPLIAMLIAVALFVAAAAAGQALASAIVPGTGIAGLVTRNATVLATVLMTYKLAITRLGAVTCDDLQARGALPRLAAGTSVGFLLMAVAVAAAAAAHVYKLLGEGDASELARQLVVSAIMPAFMEEILFRGILFRWIEDFAGSWAALVITSALFGLAHILNPNATWFSSLAIALEAGLMLGGAYMLTRSLWLPIGLHAAWNFTQGEIFGVPVSGEPVHGLLKSRLSGPPLLAGGGFGLEASVIALVIATGAGLVFIGLAVRRGELVRPMWRRPAPDRADQRKL